MSLDFSFHRRKRRFPFPVFGLVASLGMAVVFFLYLYNGYDLSALTRLDLNEEIMGYAGFTIIVTSFLLYMLSLGIIANIRADFRFLLHFSSIALFVFVFLTGYFMGSEYFERFMIISLISSIIHHIFLVVFFLLQKRSSAGYGSVTMMAVTTFPLVPVVYFIIRIYLTSAGEFISSESAIDFYLKLLLPSLIFISTLANSIYMIQVNRKVR